MMRCEYNYECPRLNYCYQKQIKNCKKIYSQCIHNDIFTTTNVNIIFPLCIYSIFLGFCCAGNFGTGAVQVFFLMLWMNYSRTETSGIAQPMLAGVCFANWLRNLGETHPLRNSPLIDYQLSVLLLPILLGAYIGGVNLRFYVPVFFISVFFVFQLIFIFLKTLVKVRSINAIENAHNVVRRELLRQNSVKDQTPKLDSQYDQEIKLSKDVSHQENILSVIDISCGHEEFHVDYVEFFKQIAHSKYRELYLQNLPNYMLEEEFIDPEKDQVMSLKDLLEEQQNKISENVPQLTDGLILKEECVQLDTNKDATVNNTKKMKVSSIKINKPVGELEDLIQHDFKDIVVVLETKKEEPKPQLKAKPKHKVALEKSPYIYPSPLVEIVLMFMIIILNIINFIFRGGKKLESIAGVKLCSDDFWILFWVQIGGNYLLFIPIFLIQKIRHDREYKIAVEMNNQKKIKVNEDQSNLTPVNPKTRVRKPRIDFPYNIKAFTLFWVVGTFSGILLGFIGLGSSLLMVIVLGKLRLNQQSLNATIPMLIFFICVLGTLIQISVGYVKWEVSLFYFGLSAFGGFLFVPSFQKLFQKLHITSIIVKLALTIYLWIWIPQIKKDVGKQFSLSASTIC